MPSMLTNPYYGMNALRDPDMFFGRSNTLRRIYSAIANRQCISLAGSLHLGKSSVLHCLRMPEIQRRFDYNLKHHILVLIDLRAYPRKSAEDFFREVSRQMVLQSRGRLELTLSQGSGEDVFSNVLDEINDQGCYPVLLMDAFDNVTRNQHFDPEFFSFLRSQAGRVSYVTASTSPLYEARHRAIENSPFFNIF